MTTKTFSMSVKSLDQILAEQKEQGHCWTVVKPSDFDSKKWKLREVDLSDSSLVSQACEEGKRILETSGLYVDRFILAEEIKKPMVIPWRAIGMVVGAIALIFGVIALLPVILVSVALVVLLMIDPVLIAVVTDGEEETWIQVAFWHD